jgi:hypothetical protein
MAFDRERLGDLLDGPLASASEPLVLTARLGELRPRFLPKGRVGRGYRAIARNGRVLLASDRPVTELAGRVVRLRVQTWHRAILPGEPPEPYGLLLCVREAEAGGEAAHTAELVARVRMPEGVARLVLDVGGGSVLAFCDLKNAMNTSTC